MYGGVYLGEYSTFGSTDKDKFLAVAGALQCVRMMRVVWA